ncbi:MAG: right-handed parallel beta-helix repeat-containing protein, partial [Anaerolineales bacterium]
MTTHLPLTVRDARRPAALLAAVAVGLLLAAALLALLAAPLLVAYAAPSAILCAGEAPYPTIQAALNAANPGDVVRVKTGLYHENLTISRSVALLGGFAGAGCTAPRNPRTSVVDAGGLGNAISITAVSQAVAVDGFEIRKANGYGILAAGGYDAALVIHDNNVHDNSGGGGIYAGLSPRSLVQIGANRIFSNSGSSEAGVYAYAYVSSTLQFNNNVIISNTAANSDGGFYVDAEYDSILTMNDNQVLSNTAAGSSYGGGYIYAYTNVTGSIERNLFQGNRASGSYGGAYVDIEYNSHLTFSDNQFLKNTADGDWGGFYLYLYYHSSAVGSGLLADGNKAANSYGGGYISAEYNSTFDQPGIIIRNNTAGGAYGG